MAHVTATKTPPDIDAHSAMPSAAGPTRVTTACPGGAGNTTRAVMPASTNPVMTPANAAVTHHTHHQPDSAVASGAATSPTNTPPDRDTARRSSTRSPG